MQTTARAKNNTVLILLLVVFAGPILFAYVMIQKNAAYELQTTNFGELILPGKNVTAINIYNSVKKEELPWGELNGKWWLVYMSADNCGPECNNMLYNMGQIRKALGKNYDRVEKMFLTLPECQVNKCDDYIIEHYPDMLRAVIDSTSYASIFKDISDNEVRKEIGELYIVDPLGNLVMHYDADVEPKGILKDLKRLLRLSNVG